jgi:molybdopterin converting factor small subunit
VRALGVARSYVEGIVHLDLKGNATVEEVLKSLPNEIQELAEHRELSVMVNGADISAREGLSTSLQDGDEVTLLPFAHGGRGQ